MPPSKKATASNGWNEYQRLVLFRLDEQTTKLAQFEIKIDGLEEKIDAVQTTVSLLKWKVATISSAMGGLFGAAVAYWVK